jgi:hypothetical protein
MPEPTVPEEILRHAARESWEGVKALWPGGPDRYVELMLLRPDYRALAQSLYTAARLAVAREIVAAGDAVTDPDDRGTEYCTALAIVEAAGG